MIPPPRDRAFERLFVGEDRLVAEHPPRLAAVEGVRPADEAPPVRQDPKVMSLMSTLATGVLIGPAGDEYQTQRDLLAFFEKVVCCLNSVFTLINLQFLSK